MNSIYFHVDGKPMGQPRPRAFARKMGNAFVARVYEGGSAEGWKSEIALAAREFIPKEKIAGPIHLTLHFFIPRPKSHYGTGKNAKVLKPSAPMYHTSKPDADNLTKAACDALTRIGMWEDDDQVVVWDGRKVYHESPGMDVWINELGEE